MAYIFTIGSLAITVYTLQHVGGNESVQFTRQLFSDYGYSLGSVIFALQLFFSIFVFPFMLNLILSASEEFSFYKYISRVTFSAFEAYGLYQFSSHFLNMYSDMMALYVLTNGRFLFPILNIEKIVMFSAIIALFSFAIFLIIRLAIYLKKT